MIEVSNVVVGLDVHQKEIVGCLLRGEERIEWRMANDARAIRRWCRKTLRTEGEGVVRVVYEAGPCGYVVQRQLESEGIECEVVAPSLIPTKPGDRVKTDRRDAFKLADLERGNQLTYVVPPTEAEESDRDLCRCREDCKEDLKSARHRIATMLRRRGLRYLKGGNWTKGHRSWLWSLKLEHPSAQKTLEFYLLSMDQIETRLGEISAAIDELAEEKRYRRVVGVLRCFRGIDTLTAMTLVTELHDVRRFLKARQLMAYVGLVPSEYSSGERRKQGAITKAGNSHVRRVLIESSWHNRHRPAIGVALAKRRKGQDPAAIALADKAMARLHSRYWRLVNRGKSPQAAATAVARELVGFVWAAMHLAIED